MNFTHWKLLLSVFATLLFEARSNTECTVWGKTISDFRNGKISNPEKLSSRTTCTWTFKVLQGQVLQLNFTRMELTLAHQCQFSYVEVTAKKEIQRFCGKRLPPTMFFKGGQEVEVVHKFNRDSKQREFTMEYKEVKKIDEICPKDKYKCRNRICISMDQRCNGKDDCGDGTDENTCGHKVEIPKECGRPAITPELGNGDRIVGGTEAVPGSWPWQVSFQKISLFPSGHFCGGSILNNFWIVSAAHCFTIIRPENVRVKLGDHRSFEIDEGEVTRYISKISIHPSYSDSIKDKRDDIAMVKVEAPIEYGPTISPVCLPQYQDNIPPNTMLHVTGWGRILGSLNPQIETTGVVLKQAMVPSVEWKQCYSEHLEKLARETICTSFGEVGTGPCIGDSGGPLVSPRNGSNLWTLFGIVSWGRTTCEFSDVSAVYTKVSSYIPWINNIIIS